MAGRRGGDWDQVTLGDHDAPQGVSPAEIIDLSDAMEKLAAEVPSKAEVAKLCLFGGLTIVEIADVLELSKPTVARRWSYAKAWLSRELGRDRT
jgi:DNA-directed RNA polymerase specialized sigma24 family protein